MSDDITMAAVMECLAESDSIAKSWKQCKSSGDTSLENILKHADPNDANVQIVSDYINSHKEVGDYILKDCSAFGYDTNHDGNVGGEGGKGEVSAKNYGRSVLVTSSEPSAGKEKAWVGFNGSSGHEWVDNGEGLYQESTMAQRAAAARFDQYIEEYNLKSNDDIVVTGHSKGGNKAMYVTMNSHYAKMIDSCVALDGQGFSQEAIDYWKEMYGEAGVAERSDKITLVSGKNDYVHELGICIAKNKITVDYHGDYQSLDDIDFSNLNQNELAQWHMHEYMFQKGADGKFTSKMNAETKPGDVDRILSSFMNSYMKLSTEERKNTAPAVMTFLQKLRGDGTSTNIDGKEILVDLQNLGSTVMWAINDAKLWDDIAWFLMKKYPLLTPLILAAIAFLKHHVERHDTSSGKNDYAEGHARLIMLNEESFIEMKSRYITAFDYGKQASEYAKKAEALQTNRSIWMTMIQTMDVKTDAIVGVMDVIVKLFKQTDEDLAKKTERIGEDYFDSQVVSGLLSGQNVFVTDDGHTVVCPPDLAQAALESGSIEDVHKCIDEYVKCIDDAYAA